LHQIDKKIQKMQEEFNQEQIDVMQAELGHLHHHHHQQQSPIDESVSSLSNNAQHNYLLQSSSPQNNNNQNNENQTSPSPASSSVSLSSSLTNSASNTPPPPPQLLQTTHVNNNNNTNTNTNNGQSIVLNNQQLYHNSSYVNRSYNMPNGNQTSFNLPNIHQIQNQLINSVNNNNNNSFKNQQNRKQLSKSFRDILENTLLINGFNDICLENNNNNNAVYTSSQTKSIHRNGPASLNVNNATVTNQHHTLTKINKSVSSFENNQPKSNNNNSKMNLTNQQYFDYNNSNLLDQNYISGSPSHRNKLVTNANNQNIPTTPVVVNTQLVMKFAELERNLALTKAENNNLLEQQVNYFSI